MRQSKNDAILEDSEETFGNCLIANDDPSQLYCLKLICENLGFKVTTACNGHEAYEIVLKQINKIEQREPSFGIKNVQEYFDLIILDLNMPISDGYEACKNIQSLYNDNKIFRIGSSSSKNV